MELTEVNTAKKTAACSRRTGLDLLRALSCIAVVLIHYSFPEPIGTVVKAMCRFAVPCFLMTSGYFYEKHSNARADYAVRQLRATLCLLLIAAVFYSVYTCCYYQAAENNWSWQAFQAERVTWARVMKLLLTDDPFVYAHLWYLPALCKCYLFVLLTDRRPRKSRSTRWLYPFAMVFGLLGFTLMTELKKPLLNGLTTSLHLWDSGELLILSNLFLFRALPFFLLGILLARLRVESRKELVLPAVVALGGTVAAAFECSRGTWQFYLGTYLQAGFLFTVALRLPETGKRFARFGQSCATWIYLTHIAIGNCCSQFIGRILHLWGTPWSAWGLPAAALLCSILCGLLHACMVSAARKKVNA